MEDPRPALVRLARRMHALGHAVATSGNFSARLDATRFTITASGLDKGALVETDFVDLDLALRVERAGPGARPSAETAIHAALYRMRPDVGAIAHTHSVAATVVSRRVSGDALVLSGYEMAKALAGVATHEVAVRLPVLENSQDVPALAERITALGARVQHGLLLRGHGLYTLGADVAETARHVEALEFLVACALHEV